MEHRRGREFDLIRLAFSDWDEFQRVAARRSDIDPGRFARIEQQARSVTSWNA
jgi:hypothetical protein